VSRYQAPKGTEDFLPPESAELARLVGLFAGLAERSGFGLVVTPSFEDVELFRHGVGPGSEIATEEMYEFSDKSNRRLALRPEGTASVVRAFIEHRPPLPFKGWYLASVFRYERPQAGRYREHHQLGVEALGSSDPYLDVEVIALLADLSSALGLRRVELRLNSLGDSTCRPGYLAALVEFFAGHAGDLCPDHAMRYAANPLRVLDCKKDACRAVCARGAPRLSAFLCKPCAAHFESVTSGVDRLGLAFRHDESLVRGLDYYERTTFEFNSLALASAQNAIGGGGRYDGLVGSLGGPPTPGVGFGSGVERLLLAARAESSTALRSDRLGVFVIDLTGGGEAMALTAELRRAGISAERAFDDRSLKAQLKLADRSGARLALIVGDDELASGVVSLRELRGGPTGNGPSGNGPSGNGPSGNGPSAPPQTGSQYGVPRDEILAFVRARLFGREIEEEKA
jgi:histidyl-tRNA synthetase